MTTKISNLPNPLLPTPPLPSALPHSSSSTNPSPNIVQPLCPQQKPKPYTKPPPQIPSIPNNPLLASQPPILNVPQTLLPKLCTHSSPLDPSPNPVTLPHTPTLSLSSPLHSKNPSLSKLLPYLNTLLFVCAMTPKLLQSAQPPVPHSSLTPHPPSPLPINKPSPTTTQPP